MERWKQINEYENYFVSNLGNVKNSRGRHLKTELSNTGYYRVHLSKHGKARHIAVHRLVASAFLDNPNNLKLVNHKDGNKLNNTLENLEWVTYSQNLQHAYDSKLRIGNLGERNGGVKLTKLEVIEIRKLYKKQSKEYGSYALARKFNVCSKTILNIVKREHWKEVQ